MNEIEANQMAKELQKRIDEVIEHTLAEFRATYINGTFEVSTKTQTELLDYGIGYKYEVRCTVSGAPSEMNTVDSREIP